MSLSTKKDSPETTLNKINNQKIKANKEIKNSSIKYLFNVIKKLKCFFFFAFSNNSIEKNYNIRYFHENKIFNLSFLITNIVLFIQIYFKGKFIDNIVYNPNNNISSQNNKNANETLSDNNNLNIVNFQINSVNYNLINIALLSFKVLLSLTYLLTNKNKGIIKHIKYVIYFNVFFFIFYNQFFDILLTYKFIDYLKNNSIELRYFHDNLSINYYICYYFDHSHIYIVYNILILINYIIFINYNFFILLLTFMINYAFINYKIGLVYFNFNLVNKTADKLNYDINASNFLLNLVLLLIIYAFAFFVSYKYERSKRKFFIYKQEYNNTFNNFKEILNVSNKIQYIKFNSSNILFSNYEFKDKFKLYKETKKNISNIKLSESYNDKIINQYSDIDNKNYRFTETEEAMFYDYLSTFKLYETNFNKSSFKNVSLLTNKFITSNLNNNNLKFISPFNLKNNFFLKSYFFSNITKKINSINSNNFESNIFVNNNYKNISVNKLDNSMSFSKINLVEFNNKFNMLDINKNEDTDIYNYNYNYYPTNELCFIGFFCNNNNKINTLYKIYYKKYIADYPYDCFNKSHTNNNNNYVIDLFIEQVVEISNIKNFNKKNNNNKEITDINSNIKNNRNSIISTIEKLDTFKSNNNFIKNLKVNINAKENIINDTGKNNRINDNAISCCINNKIFDIISFYNINVSNLSKSLINLYTLNKITLSNIKKQIKISAIIFNNSSFNRAILDYNNNYNYYNNCNHFLNKSLEYKSFLIIYVVKIVCHLKDIVEFKAIKFNNNNTIKLIFNDALEKYKYCCNNLINKNTDFIFLLINIIINIFIKLEEYIKHNKENLNLSINIDIVKDINRNASFIRFFFNRKNNSNFILKEIFENLIDSNFNVNPKLYNYEENNNLEYIRFNFNSTEVEEFFELDFPHILNYLELDLSNSNNRNIIETPHIGTYSLPANNNSNLSKKSLNTELNNSIGYKNNNYEKIKVNLFDVYKKYNMTSLLYKNSDNNLNINEKEILLNNTNFSYYLVKKKNTLVNKELYNSNLILNNYPIFKKLLTNFYQDNDTTKIINKNLNNNKQTNLELELSFNSDKSIDNNSLISESNNKNNNQRNNSYDNLFKYNNTLINQITFSCKQKKSKDNKNIENIENKNLKKDNLNKDNKINYNNIILYSNSIANDSNITLNDIKKINSLLIMLCNNNNSYKDLYKIINENNLELDVSLINNSNEIKEILDKKFKNNIISNLNNINEIYINNDEFIPNIIIIEDNSKEFSSVYAFNNYIDQNLSIKNIISKYFVKVILNNNSNLDNLNKKEIIKKFNFDYIILQSIKLEDITRIKIIFRIKQKLL